MNNQEFVGKHNSDDFQFIATIVFADPHNLRVNEVSGINGLDRVGVAHGMFDVSSPNPAFACCLSHTFAFWPRSDYAMHNYVMSSSATRERATNRSCRSLV